MANKNSPFGLRAVKHLNGSPYNGQFNMYNIPATDATATYVGDIVKVVAGDDGNGIKNVTAITAVGDSPIGVVVGFKYDPTNLMLKHRPASTQRYAYVADATDIVFESQDSGTTATGDVGKNIQPSIAAGSATTGVSGQQLDGTTKATTSTHMFKLVRIVQRPDAELGTNGKFEVIFNRHQNFPASTGV